MCPTESSTLLRNKPMAYNLSFINANNDNYGETSQSWGKYIRPKSTGMNYPNNIKNRRLT